MSGEAVRRYSDDEHSAFRTANHHFKWNPKYERGRGPAEYAGGGWWPAKMRAEADRLEWLAPRLRTAAAALEREIATDPRTAPTDPAPTAADAAEEKSDG